MVRNNHIFKVLAIIVSMLMIGQFLESFRSASTLLSDYFEVVTELLPLVLSFSVFAISWFAYGKSRDRHSIFLGATFLVIGLFDLFHMLSYPYMPDFITPNSLLKAMAFWSEGRLISAFLFIASVYVYKNHFSEIISKLVLLSSAVLLSAVSLVGIFQYLDQFQQFFYPDGSISAILIIILIVSDALTVYAIYLYLNIFKETHQKGIICLIYGLSIIVFSNSIYLLQGFSGHLLKAAGFYFVYYAQFKSSIEQPYERMADTEHKLRFVAEQKYRSLFDNANDAIIITDIDERINSWNRGAELIFGWESKDVEGKKLSELTVPSHLKSENDRIIRTVLSGTAVTGFDTVRQRKDGSEIDVNITVSPLRVSEHNIIGLSSIIRDITERKKAEKALQESEERYRRLVELSPDAIAVHSEGRIIFINDAGARLLGAENPESLVGKRIMDFIYPDYRGIAQKRMDQIIKEGKIAPLIEEKFIRMDGKVIDVEEVAMPFTYNGRPSVQMVIHDITERKRALEALRRSEEHFRSLIENSSDIIAILGNARTILYLSPSVEKSLGYKPKELAGRDILEIIHPEDLPGFTENFIQKIKNQDTTASMEVRVRHKDGSWRILESIGKKLPEGLVVNGIVLNSRDITERKLAEKRIRASLAEKEVLLREIHHRVKNNMQVISSLLNLQSNFSKDEKVAEMFKESRNRIISMSLIHEKLYQSENFSKIDLKGYVEELVNGLFHSYGVSTGKIRQNIHIDDISLGIDSAIPCGLIINELVSNSLKYAFPDDKRGEITVAIHRTDDSMIELTVKDNGVGIPEDLDIEKGKTLGLHLVRMLAENQLQGSIALDRNGGTGFQIRFRGAK
jgi:PAS domain S-box-containing protein